MKFLDISFRYLLSNLSFIKAFPILSNKINLFCVGDDAQSIYGFRGADFENIHKFKDNVKNSTILKVSYSRMGDWEYRLKKIE